MPDGWTLVAPASQAQGWTPVQAAAPESGGGFDAAKRFVIGFAHNVDPRPALKLVYDGVTGIGGMLSGDMNASQALADDLKGLGQNQIDQFKKGYEAYKQGRYSEAAGHTLAGALPLVGPAAAAAGEQIGSGDVAGGFGASTGLLAQMAAPKVVAKVVPRSVQPFGGLRNMNAVAAEAVDFGRRSGIPIDAATATGSELVKSVQKKVSDSMGGADIAERFKTEQSSRLASVGEQLAAKANKGGLTVTPEQAGQATQGGLRDVVHEWNTEASGAYERLRKMEADPKNTTVIQPEVGVQAEGAPSHFVLKAKPTADEVFLSAYQDAKQQGYKGTAAELKAKFDDRIGQARSLREVTAEGADEHGHQAFLRAIRENGGIRPYDKGLVQGSKSIEMRGEYDAIKSQFAGQRVFNEGGKALDDMVDALQSDPKWKHVVNSETDLLEMLGEIARKPKAGIESNIEHYLNGVGVRPGVQWWNENAPAQSVPMAVDLRAAKQGLQAAHADLQQQATLAPATIIGDKATAYQALDKIMNGPDYAPLSVVDGILGDLKTFVRSKNPDLRTSGQAQAMGAVDQLHTAVQKAAEAAGPEAVQALTEGRQATTAKYIAAKVLEGVAGPKGDLEPVGTYRRLTAPGDSAAQLLRSVAHQTPEVLPQIGRAVLDGFMDTATSNGSFDHARSIRAKWDKLGPQTKVMLFREPGYIKDIDNFFRLADKIAENPNPAGTARINKLFNVTSAAVGYPIAKLLYSDAGVKLLTQGLRIPLQSPTLLAAYTTRLTAALKAAQAAQPVMAGDNQAPQPTTIGRR